MTISNHIINYQFFKAPHTYIRYRTCSTRAVPVCNFHLHCDHHSAVEAWHLLAEGSDLGAGLASMEAADAPLQAGVAVVCFWSVKIQIQMGALRHRSASSCLRLGAHIQCRHRNLQMSLWDLRGWGGWFFRQMVKVHPIFQFEHIVSLKSSGGRFFQKGSCSALHLDVSWFFPLHPVGSFAMNGNQRLELRSCSLDVIWNSLWLLPKHASPLQAYNANILVSLMLFYPCVVLA